MPRPNPVRSIYGEATLAQRIAFERRSLGMSLEGLAKRMTDNGCPIAPSAIYKIESGDPPRRITVDELVALSKVFKVEMAELLEPPDSFRNKRAQDLLVVLESIRQQLATLDEHATKLQNEEARILRELEALESEMGTSNG